MYVCVCVVPGKGATNFITQGRQSVLFLLEAPYNLPKVGALGFAAVVAVWTSKAAGGLSVN